MKSPLPHQQKTPRVTLVGAGPGHPDLITIAGLKALEDADVVLYDALANPELLNLTPNHCRKIYVGKRSGNHSLKQQDINSILVEQAFLFGHVVRLKGGDPFVFGRASEEIEHLECFGIPVTVIPGISSVIAVPSNQGIPLTKRNCASSFWVATATTKNGSLSEDLILASQSNATLVILMGIRKLVEIAQLIERYRGSLTPMAIIQNGTLASENCFTGTISEAKKISRKINEKKPGIIIIGDVVSEHPSFYEDEIQRVLHSTL